MDAKELKKQLNIEHYRQIFTELGAEWKETNGEYWQLKTGCHNLNWEDGSYKLYFYLDTQTFFCFTHCNVAFDIFELIHKRWGLEKKPHTFRGIIKWICGVVGFSERVSVEDRVNYSSNWKSILNPYINTKNNPCILRSYNKDVLQAFPALYHESFIKDNISIQTMQRWQVGYYVTQNQITLPVFDKDGRLVGIHCRNLDKARLARGQKYIPLRLLGGEEYKFKTGQVLYGINYNQYMIKRTGRAILFEAPKSVLQMASYFGITNSVAKFGSNLSITQRNLLLDLGVKEVVIADDKQYKQASGDEWHSYCARVVKIAKMFNGYCKVTAIVDDKGLLEYKDSPSDKGKEVWTELFKSRKLIKT